MSLREAVSDIKALLEHYKYEINTTTVRAEIIDVLSEHPSVGMIIDQSDANDPSSCKFLVEVEGKKITFNLSTI